MSKYLVTGGCGFIGSHLVKLLVQKGNQVVVLDDLSTGSLDNLLGVDYKFVQGSVLDQDILKKLFKNIDGCFHLVAIASVQKSINNWHYAHQVNLTGTVNIFLQSSVQDVPVVYASSAAVYGEADDFPLRENSKINPLSPYAVDKYSCELQAKVFGKLKYLKSCGLRFFNVYGVGQLKDSDYSGVISIFKQQVEVGGELKIFGNGQQSRDFIHISDVTEMCMRSMGITSISAPILNVCTGISSSINELAQIISKIGYVKAIEYLPEQVGSINISVGCPKLAYESLDYQAKYGLEIGLLELFSQNMKGSNTNNL